MRYLKIKLAIIMLFFLVACLTPGFADSPTNPKLSLRSMLVEAKLTQDIINSDINVNHKNWPLSKPKPVVVVASVQEEKMQLRSQAASSVASRGGSIIPPHPNSAAQKYEVTAYCLRGSNGRTATGMNLNPLDVTAKLIAVDPRYISLGSKVYIEFPDWIRYVRSKSGQTVDLNGFYTAVDTGGAIKGHKIDLFVGGRDDYTHNLALKIGRQWVKVYKVGGNDS